MLTYPPNPLWVTAQTGRIRDTDSRTPSNQPPGTALKHRGHRNAKRTLPLTLQSPDNLLECMHLNQEMQAASSSHLGRQQADRQVPRIPTDVRKTTGYSVPSSTITCLSAFPPEQARDHSDRLCHDVTLNDKMAVLVQHEIRSSPLLAGSRRRIPESFGTRYNAVSVGPGVECGGLRVETTPRGLAHTRHAPMCRVHAAGETSSRFSLRS